MDDTFPWKAILKALVLPPGGPLLLALVGLALIGRYRRFGRVLALAGVLSLLALALPVVAAALISLVDDSPPLDMTRAASAQAVVILGGGTRPGAPEYGGDTMSRLTLERVRYGARVARQTHLPVIVVGGRSDPARATEAKVMRDALENEYGVAVRWTEDRSRNTHENAVNAAAILHADGVRRVVLVAHGFDMPRATAEFADAGIETIPAPTGIAGLMREGSWGDYVPTVEAMQRSYYALYELLAIFVRKWTT